MTYSRLLRTTIVAAALTFSSVMSAVAQGIVEFPVPTTSLSVPTGITTAPDGNVWFTDGLNFQSGGQTSLPIGRITATGAITQFSLADQPFEGLSGIVTGPDGALWFTGPASNVIGRITTAGRATSFPIPTHNSVPLNITVGSVGRCGSLSPRSARSAVLQRAVRLPSFQPCNPLARHMELRRGPTVHYGLQTSMRT